jgi:hypothetical protein
VSASLDQLIGVMPEAEPAPRGERIGQVAELEIPGAVKTLNELLRMHFREKHRYQQNLAWLIRCSDGFLRRPEEPFTRARVTIWRHSTRMPDHDGLYGGCKLLIDCLTTPYERKMRKAPPKPWLPVTYGNPQGLRFIVDDNPRACLLRCESVVCLKGLEKMAIRIEELLPLEVLA